MKIMRTDGLVESEMKLFRGEQSDEVSRNEATIYEYGTSQAIPWLSISPDSKAQDTPILTVDCSSKMPREAVQDIFGFMLCYVSAPSIHQILRPKGMIGGLERGLKEVLCVRSSRSLLW